jgi:hypothetical protein
MEILRWADPQQRHAPKHMGARAVEIPGMAAATPAATPVPA